jgi:hypothetical protein
MASSFMNSNLLKSPKVMHRFRCKFDTTLHSITRMFRYNFYIYIYIYKNVTASLSASVSGP